MNKVKIEPEVVDRFCANPECPSHRPDGTGRFLGRAPKGDYVAFQCLKCRKWTVFNPPMFREETAIVLDKLPDFW